MGRHDITHYNILLIDYKWHHHSYNSWVLVTIIIKLCYRYIVKQYKYVYNVLICILDMGFIESVNNASLIQWLMYLF